MQRIIQINIAGRVIPIEDDAYNMLKDYLSALERQFVGADGKEIIEDIENRIAELFMIRQQSGSAAIDRSDVQMVIAKLGAPTDINDGHTQSYSSGRQSAGYSGQSTYSRQNYYVPRKDRLFRDPYNKMIGGVCSGLAHYFDVDTVIIRLIMAVLFLMFGVGFLAYIIAWAIIPQARSLEELNYGTPMSFHDITQNVGEELEDLKKRGEQMSRELKDFFSKKK
ncbi:hypothetical protein CJD36_018395 [Flavipsychrobacter stenotrophus]|uniref:Phage shock protein PspC N-terminal domain-containing protein n=1 Tax=Flavipsychrobacter stenotrophus TaxID=2077091 RepID=A0A2S7SSJ0_9BACT|nr:PspC domain-containing protein [Flavipsychrobacter stenotrophus]PQJ09892.1 hypothetical protein CJD36_018395 [Flavipsychrobacter stenotrophus]